MRHIYGANLAIHQNKPDELLDHAEQINGKIIKIIIPGAYAMCKGNFDEAAEFLKSDTPWMIHSLKAVLFKEKNDYQGFRSEADKSIESAIGMQRYVVASYDEAF